MKLRSVLFTPGGRPERIIKAWTHGAADVVVADLEDAVAPSDKDTARQAVLGALASTDTAPCRAVRINAWPSAVAAADLEALAEADVAWIVVPKAESVQDLEDLADRLPGDAQMLIIIETAAGALRAAELALVDGVGAIAFGAEDLAADAGMQRTPGNDEIAVPRSMVALAAAAARIPAIDMITADFQDDERFRRESQEAVGLGYAGKMCLHPRQVAIAHEAWAPSDEQIAWARKVVAAANAPGASGVVVVDDRMIDAPLIRQAEAILERAN